MPARGFQGALEPFPARIVAGEAFVLVCEEDFPAHGQAVSALAFVLLLAAIALRPRTRAVPGIENRGRHGFLPVRENPAWAAGNDYTLSRQSSERHLQGVQHDAGLRFRRQAKGLFVAVPE